MSDDYQPLPSRHEPSDEQVWYTIAHGVPGVSQGSARTALAMADTFRLDRPTDLFSILFGPPSIQIAKHEGGLACFVSLGPLRLMVFPTSFNILDVENHPTFAEEISGRISEFLTKKYPEEGFDAIRSHSLDFLCQGYEGVLHLLAEYFRDRVQRLIDRASLDRHVPLPDDDHVKLLLDIDKLSLELQGIISNTTAHSIYHPKVMFLLLRDTFPDDEESVSKLSLALHTFSENMTSLAKQLYKVKRDIEMIKAEGPQHMRALRVFMTISNLLVDIFLISLQVYRGMTREELMFGIFWVFLFFMFIMIFRPRYLFLR